LINDKDPHHEHFQALVIDLGSGISLTLNFADGLIRLASLPII
jgi:hypothetical protein